MRSLVASLLVLAGSAVAAANPLPPHFDDASLHAVQFVDKNEGWAVGDQGGVWHTIDGGKTWERQTTGSRACLKGVCFLTPYTGWVVGRTELPADAGSSGVILTTADGGLTWTELTSGVLPGLNAVRVFDEKTAVVCGDGSAGSPAGVFTTSDAGKTWVAANGGRAPSWQGAAFSSDKIGVVGGAWGRLATFTDGKLKPAEIDSLGTRSVRGIAMSGAAGVAVGDGGLVLTTATGGTKWAVADTKLPAAVAEGMNFRCVASFGQSVWAAGRPGSVVLRSADFGKTWDSVATGWHTPINALCAISDKEVWAVGDLGAVLKSTDGGTTWAVQRCGGMKAAALFAHGAAKTVPLETVALLGGRDGHFVAAMTVTCADPITADPKRATDPHRLHAAVREASGLAADACWQFPIPGHLSDGKSDALFAAWVKQHGPAAEDKLVAEMVLAIRMWRPDVVVADAVVGGGPDASLVIVAAQKAFKLSGDEKAFPDQLTALHLKPHKAKKLYTGGPESGKDCHVKYDQTAFAKQLLDSPAGFAEPACALFDTLPPARRCFAAVTSYIPDAKAHTALMDGTDLTAGGPSRRKLPVFDGLLDPLIADREQLTKKRQQLEQLVAAAESTGGADKALARIGTDLKRLPDDVAAKAVIGLARQLAAEGKWVAARELNLLALQKYSAYPETVEAVRWLSRYYASGEARRRAELLNKLIVTDVAFAPVGVKQASNQQPVVNAKEIRLTDGEGVQIWGKACVDLESKLAGFGPVYSRDPATILCAHASRRQMGRTGDAAKQLGDYFRTTPGAADRKPGEDHWRDCLAAEMWLANKQAIAVPPKPFALCPKAAVKPFLDGKLDDECWKAFKPLELKNVSGAGLAEYGTKAYFTFDDEFVYVAVECTHPEGKQQPKAEARRRDDDLRGFDRVDLLFDLDRDYQTYYRFQIDQRGCVAEDCWGDRSWNPKYFAAVEPTPTGWTAEIAIPRSELTGAPLTHHTTWAMNVSRVVPGVGVRTWSGTPTAAPRPECMGLMQFFAEK